MAEKEWMKHDSHLPMFRHPFGAAACGANVTLRLEVGVSLKPREVILRLWQDGLGEQKISMSAWQEQDTSTVYQATFTLARQPGLLWYYFVVTCEDKIYYYGNNEQQRGGLGSIYRAVPPSYQITVHKADNQTPAWFKKCVMYQIFPDRFFNGNDDGCLTAVPEGCVIHSSWHNTPYYIRDVDTKEIVYYDFFGGNLRGIIKKLPYLQELGIGVIYLNPIFKAASNHRYDTGDYKAIDPMLGDTVVFAELCRAAAQHNMAIILDGVFSHTGSDSVYFNKYGHYDEVGAYQSTTSPYYRWYRFDEYPERYESWWGIDTLPNVNEMEPSYVDFVIENNDSVIKHWLRQGAKGWRLDVVDELPDAFVKKLRAHMKAVDADSVLIGEVWEDASLKTAYGERREYLWGDELDSTMNYPFRTIVLDFLLGHVDTNATHLALMQLYENYPRENFYALMNLIGSHDVPRILTLLGEAPPSEHMTVRQQADFKLPAAQRQLGLQRLKIAVAWQMTFPGVPSVYYGDEVGMEGYRDPFNRKTLPWGEEEQELQDWHRAMITLRNRYTCFSTGQWQGIYHMGDVYAYIRKIENGQDVFGQAAADDRALVVFNRNRYQTVSMQLDVGTNLYGWLEDALDADTRIRVNGGKVSVVLPPLSVKIYIQDTKALYPRECGVLLHPTSLPSRYGIGDLGPEAYQWIDFLAAAKQKVWQICPLNPVGYGDSPYQCLSAFAGSPLLISPDELLVNKWLTPADLVSLPKLPSQHVDYEAVKVSKNKLLRAAYQRFQQQPPDDYLGFVAEERAWLPDYALFMALKEHFSLRAWSEWDETIARRDPLAVAAYRTQLADECEFHMFVQYVFFRQWQRLKDYANARGIAIIGDMPIFVAYDSADVWAKPWLFKLDERRRPITVAGVPPDRFSDDGQLWGNPHYNWSEMEKDQYSWWQLRFRVLGRLVDRIRVDHFLGFENHYEIPFGDATAAKGKWVKGPGAKFFDAMIKHLGDLAIIAEDLGVITQAVEDLKNRYAFPGMKILQFSFYPDAQQPEGSLTFAKNSFIYTGTHDNDTTVSWYQAALEQEPMMVKRMLTLLGFTGDPPAAAVLCERLIEYAYAANANSAIIPLQDILLLGGEARMNLPGSLGGNWQWRYEQNQLNGNLAAKLAALATVHKR